MANNNDAGKETHCPWGEENMSNSINRRTFIKQGTVIGASTLLGTHSLGLIENLAFAAGNSEIAAATGENYYKNTVAAVELIGGIKKYVSKQSTVGLLINSPWRYPGSFVKPEISLAAIHMCLEAGAKEIGVFKSLSNSYWRRSTMSDQIGDEVRGLRDMSGNYRDVRVPGGRSLQRADVASDLLDCDVFINISIAKDHTGTRFTGTMKNMMGALSGSTNSFFHHGSGKGFGYYDDVEFLSQCIADVNLLRKPELCLLDATEILKTNGPGGPGQLLKPQTVLAGTDRVALDGYGAQLLGLRPDDIMTVRMAHEHGMGELDFSRIQIHKKTV